MATAPLDVINVREINTSDIYDIYKIDLDNSNSKYFVCAITVIVAAKFQVLNILDGGTSATSTTLAAADRMVINDNGTMVQVALTDLVTFLENGSVSGFDIDGGTY